jgi:hypothetical protein
MKENKEKYPIDSCPVCHSSNIEDSGDTLYFQGSVFVGILCNNCNTEYEIEYIYKGYKIESYEE